MIRLLLATVIFLTLAIVAPSATNAQDSTISIPEITSAEEAADTIRTLFRHRDFSWGNSLGSALAERFPDAEELRAWALLHKAEHGGMHFNGERFRQAAIEQAEEMLESNAESAWAWFALAATARFIDDRQEAALRASRHALELAPGNPDMVWLKAEVLNTLDRYDDTIEHVRTFAGHVDNPSDLYVSKISALNSAIEDEEQKWAAMEKAFAAAVEADSLNPNAHYLYGWYLNRGGNQEDGFPLLQRAAAMMPTSVRVQHNYWLAVQNHRGLSSDEKRDRIIASVEALVTDRSEAPFALLHGSGQFDQLGEHTRQRELLERILEIAPDSEEGEWALVERYRAFRNEHGDAVREEPEIRAEFRRMLEEFINRPQPIQKQLLGEAYRELFLLLKDDATITDQELLDIVNGMVTYEDMNVHITHGRGAVALARQTDFYERARKIANEGIELAGQRINAQFAQGAYDDEEHYLEERNAYVSLLQSALGWVYFHEGRIEEAEAELNEAYQMHRENIDNLHRLGQLYEEQGQLEQAEVFYREGFVVETMGANPNEEALENVYRELHGSLDGFEEYVAELRASDQEERFDAVLATRIEEPEPMHAFELETLDGETVSSDAFDGQILAINIWGKWCPPCVVEMPDVQELYEQYADDPGVAVLTINNDRDLDDLRAWLEDHDYTFPVLLDDGFLNEIAMYSFPTTWFVNPEGEIEFIKRGYTAELVEEFSWKIEAIRESAEVQSAER